MRMAEQRDTEFNTEAKERRAVMELSASALSLLRKPKSPAGLLNRR